MNECIVCEKELPEPLMICFNCSSTRKEDTFKAIEKLALEMRKKRKQGNNDLPTL